MSKKVTLDKDQKYTIGYSFKNKMGISANNFVILELIKDGSIMYTRKLQATEATTFDYTAPATGEYTWRMRSSSIGTTTTQPITYSLDNLSIFYSYPYTVENCDNLADGYRFGFNGKEDDRETGTQDYGFRIYNPQLGKFLSVDPLAKDYPWNSTYAFAENRVIDGIDLEGLEYVKAPTPKSTTLIIVPQAAGSEAYSFNSFYKSALKNDNFAVIKVNDLTHLTSLLKDDKTQFKNVVFADHGDGRFPAQVIGQYGYTENSLKQYSSQLSSLSKNIKSDGNIVLLGCFTAAPQTGGGSYISTFSKFTNRKVYGNQGESHIGTNVTDGRAIGGPPSIGSKKESYFDMAKTNAGKWSLSKPGGSVFQDIGNLKLSSSGTPSTSSASSPTSSSSSSSSSSNSSGNGGGNPTTFGPTGEW